VKRLVGAFTDAAFQPFVKCLPSCWQTAGRQRRMFRARRVFCAALRAVSRRAQAYAGVPRQHTRRRCPAQRADEEIGEERSSSPQEETAQ